MPPSELRRILPTLPVGRPKNKREVCPKHRRRFQSQGRGHKQACPDCVREREVMARQNERMEAMERRREERDAQAERDRLAAGTRKGDDVEGQE
jgi:hypothetical protein